MSVAPRPPPLRFVRKAYRAAPRVLDECHLSSGSEDELPVGQDHLEDGEIHEADPVAVDQPCGETIVIVQKGQDELVEEGEIREPDDELEEGEIRESEPSDVNEFLRAVFPDFFMPSGEGENMSILHLSRKRARAWSE